MLALLRCFIVLFSDSAGISATIFNALPKKVISKLALQLSSSSLYGTMADATIPLFTTNSCPARIWNIAISLKCSDQYIVNV